MKNKIKCLFALLMCISLLPICHINASATTVNYVKEGNYVYNWGEREEEATFLSPMAENFYEKYDVSYEELASLAGGTGVSDAPASALYQALQTLMSKAHTNITSYNETRPLYKYTDCENSGGKISSFYSGDLIGPEWDGGTTWNREHTWPDSKGLEGSDEDDIMMLRPTAKSENGARSNKAYGESSGYYHPNSESDGAHDVRGDVSRIFLYVYVRWGNTNGNGKYTAWGASGVMESLDVLLAWMEADPVDTWELGRNDAAEAITGTRNVFVDYPELAFVLFGAEVPSDMTTPSGIAKQGGACQHLYANNCDTDCDLCGEIRTVGNHVYQYYCSTACKHCGEAPREASHRYIGWQVIEPATAEKPGLERGKCLYCSAPGERELLWQEPPSDTPTPPLTPPEEPENPDNSEVPETPSDTNPDAAPPIAEESDSTLYVVVIAGGAVLAAAAVGSVWIFKKKKR